MSVYVDDLFPAKTNSEGNLWCHMRADSKEELHEFAQRIGRKRCWFDEGDHYDLRPTFREKAIAAGAVEVGWRKMHALRAEWRHKYLPRRKR